MADSSNLAQYTLTFPDNIFIDSIVLTSKLSGGNMSNFDVLVDGVMCYS